jgi:hypothetical protein
VGIAKNRKYVSDEEEEMRKKMFFATTLLVLMSFAGTALAVTAPPGLHKDPAASKVPSHVCARCHG